MPGDPIVLDGSAGEGGGQILRTALSLAAVTGKPFRITRVRERRPKPGLRPQHREAARAAARIVEAALEGDEVGSTELLFRPRRAPRSGDWAFDIGSAGSTPLLFQTVCWPLAFAGGTSSLVLRGGTHQDHAPSFHYLALVWAPAVSRLGFRFSFELAAAGFYPEGGGEFQATIEPAHPMPPLDLRHRGTLQEVEVVSMVAGQGFEAAERQAAQALKRLRELGIAAEAERVPVATRGSKGGHVLVVAAFERTRSGHGAVSAKDRSPEEIADLAVRSFGEQLEGRAAVDPHLGDQLLVPAALAAAGRPAPPPGVVPLSRYTVTRVTRHLCTNADVVRRFLDVDIAITGAEGEEGEVVVGPRGSAA